MAKKKRDYSKQEDLPQFNYRQPGEEDPDGGQRKFPEEGSAPKTKTEQGLSEMAGMSEPRTQKDIDDENTWSGPR